MFCFVVLYCLRTNHLPTCHRLRMVLQYFSSTSVIPYFLVILGRSATVFSVILSFSVDSEPLNFKLKKKTSLADKIVISTQQLMIPDVPLSYNFKQTCSSNLPECNILFSFTQSCSLWHFVIPSLLFYIFKQ